MIDLIKFSRGGMDQDNAKDSDKRDPNDYDEAFNFRTSGTAAGEGGNGTNYESHVKVSGPRPAGFNKGIGGRAFEHVRRIYGFIYNSNGNHLIVEFDHDTEKETILFTNKTDSGGLDILPLDPSRYVTDVQLVDNTFLVFIDSQKRICMINIERLRKKEYGVLTYDDFTLLKAQPMLPVLASYGDDSSRSVNLLRQGLYQFRSEFIYQDYLYSAWSTISKRQVPVNESTTGTDVAKANYLKVSLHVGNSNRVEEISVGARTGEGVWYEIKRISRAKVLTLTNTAIDVSQGIYEAYDPTTGYYTFAFYNDGNYNPISALETDSLNDVIPEEAGTMEVINSTLIALSDLKEGKLRPKVDIGFSVSSYETGLTYNEVANPDALKVRYSMEKKGPDFAFYHQIYFWFSGKAKTNDTFNAQVVDNMDKKSILHEYGATVEVAENDNTLKFVQRIATLIPFSSVKTETNGEIRLTFSTHRVTEHNHKAEVIGDVRIVLANAGDGASISKPALKAGSAYQGALAYYDQYGRPYPMNTDSSFVVRTPTFAELKGKAPRIDWKINSAPPKGAKYYDILLSQNNTHEKSLYVLGKESGSAADYLILYINPLKKFNENNSASVLSYGFAKGDRVTLHYMADDTTLAKTWFDGSAGLGKAIDVEVLSFEVVPEEDPSEIINYQLKIRKPAGIGAADLVNKDILLEIYTPRRRDTVNQDGDTLITTPFFETGNRFEIVNGQHSVTQGSITEGDVYMKTRYYVGAIDPNTLFNVIVEDFNFSDYYTSNYYSFGRVRAYFDTPEEVYLGSHIRYGEVYEKGSRINGLNRFYLENIYGTGPGETSSSYGRILKMEQRGGYLIILQEINNGHVPVYKTIIEDAEGQQQVAVSTRLFGAMQYNQAGNVGIGDAQTAFTRSHNGTVYFIDPNNSMPMRDGYDGLQPIPGKMSKYFQEVLHNAFRANKKVILYFNDFQKELIVTLESAEDVLFSVPMDTANIEVLESFLPPLASGITLLAAPAKGTRTYNGFTGKASYTANAGTSGSDNFTFQFTVDGIVITKRACIMIESGDTTVDQYQFTDVVDATPNTVYTSNGVLITGNNVPVPYDISGGEISINGGVWTSADGILYPDDLVQVRGTSSAGSSTATNVVLTVGGRTDTFTITTVAAPVVYGFVNIYNSDSGAADYTVKVNGVDVVLGDDGSIYFDDTFPTVVDVQLHMAFGVGNIEKRRYTAPSDAVEIGTAANTPYDGRAVANYNFTVNRNEDTYLYIDAYPAIPIQATISFGLNPITHNGLIFMRNGAENGRAGNEAIITDNNNYYPTDVMKLRQFTYGPAYPWEAGSKVKLKVMQGGVTLYDNDINVQAIETQDFTLPAFTLSSAPVFIESTGSSTAVGYTTKTLTSVSNTTEASAEIIDTTVPKTVLMVSNLTGFNATRVDPYNLKVDANTQTLRVTNLSLTREMTAVVNGAAPFSIAANTSHDFTGIAKDSITLTVNQIIP